MCLGLFRPGEDSERHSPPSECGDSERDFGAKPGELVPDLNQLKKIYPIGDLKFLSNIYIWAWAGMFLVRYVVWIPGLNQGSLAYLGCKELHNF
ncbi:hypothetical protein CDAR_263331 [Caerostris darwini]|uniref:Uncharacterized protein n=1 Tax=Caerostris darwini TaxID=1538125 RepID=A0AAV4RUT7_9ARAC|nr:hypothetical protein CDAR_263331 [Caerostris darwini]